MRHLFALLTSLLLALQSATLAADALDMDGQMDGQDTGKDYKGPPVHTISIFANPPVEGTPKPGDGINPFGNTLIEDCFIRTQDDSLYVNGLGIRRTVLWNDANGSSFVLTSMPQLADRKLIVEDCDVIYSRAQWHHWGGVRAFNMRGEGGGAAGAGVIFRNISIEDPRPTLQQFFICNTTFEPYWKDEKKSRRAGDVSGILFQNISIAAASVLNEPQLLWGQSGARIRNLTFENLTVAGKPVRDAAFFKTNEFVDGLMFVNRTR